MEIVEMIREAVIVKEKPCIFLSGGADSAIVLYHLREKTDDTIYSYSAKFGLDGDEILWSRMVAETYDTIHKEIDCSDCLDILPEILVDFEHPRYNVWTWFLFKQAKIDRRKTVYIGEGSDEHFGGYSTKNYLEAWADHLTYVMPSFETLAKKFDLDLEPSFTNLNWRHTFPFYSSPDKALLRKAYENILPRFLIERRKTPPAYTNYWQLWYTKLKEKYSGFTPSSVEDIRKLLRYFACKSWLEANLMECIE